MASGSPDSASAAQLASSNRAVVPPALDELQQAQVEVAVQGTPREAGIDLGDWNGKVVRQFVRERFGLVLGRRCCLNYLHRLGCVLKRPKKRLLQANQRPSGAGSGKR